ncbi:hypothetical protein GOBAR_AA18053 [Gossypium barbadense]|uniref:Major facilitator superfamily (MFS) profile domain-containing protein n=1 Tax=Gossypium barbadense TaxID=3634 RepID=A0A2P5XGY3_GOSBA|nr:hypothetical protein GOBAR_AA18053 [Gossypium barbadense]
MALLSCKLKQAGRGRAMGLVGVQESGNGEMALPLGNKYRRMDSDISSLAGGRTSDVMGIKWTMAFAAALFQIGAAIMTFASSFQVLMIGRILAGIGIGFGVMIAPVYIVEISPTVDRGSLTPFPEIFIILGILLGYVSNYAFSGLPVHINWRVMLAVGTLPSIFIWFALFIIPESPSPEIFKDAGIESKSKLLVATVAVGIIKTAFILIAQASALGLQEPFSSFRRCQLFRFSLFPSLYPETKGKSLEQIKLLFQRHNEWQGSEVEMEDTEHLVEKP